MASSRKFLQPINLSNISLDPVSGSAGDVYFNSASSTVRYFDGTEWKDVGSGSGGGITVSETAPTGAEEGDGWFKSSTSEFFVYDGTFWVEATSTVQVDLEQDTSPSLSASLDANEFGIENVGYIDFDLSPSASPVEGRVIWDATYDTLSVGLKDGSVLQVGQEVHIHVFNDSGDQIDDGMVVYATGIQGDRVTVAPAIADGSIEAKYFLGIATQNILDQETGYVTWFGKVNDVAGTFDNGSVLYASPTTAGALTTTEPTAPHLKLPIAFVVRQHGSNMDLMVRMTQGVYLSDSHDVNISSIQNEDILVYNSASGIWENSPIPVSLPDQTGHDGEYLTTDGTNASWTTVQSGSIQTDVALSNSWWLGV